MNLHQTIGLRRDVRAWPQQGGGVRTVWALIGDEGAVTFTMRTGGRHDDMPFGVDGHHKQPPGRADCCADVTDCDYTGGECWVDGTALGGDDLWKKVLATETSEKHPDVGIIWAELEGYYRAWFLGEDEEDE